MLPAICATVHGLIILCLMPTSWALFAWAIYYGGIQRFLALVYLFHMFFNIRDRDRGGYTHPYILESWYWRKITEFYGLHIVPLGKYPSDKNYILGVHPHGLTANGVVTFSNHYSPQFREIFGNKTQYKFITSSYNTVSPFTKDYFFGISAVNSSEESISYWLTRPEGGHIMGIVIGGAAESNLMAHNEYRLFLRKRKGFCRIALQTGTHLIPSFTFGEMECYPVIKSSGIILRMQEIFTQATGVGLPFLISVIPRRERITVVLGKPIEVERIANPTREQVNSLHEKYVGALKEVFDSQKSKYYPDKKVELQIE